MPPFSPDINIIELVWAEMKRFLRIKKLKTRQEIADRVRLFFERHLIDAAFNPSCRRLSFNFVDTEFNKFKDKTRGDGPPPVPPHSLLACKFTITKLCY